jgi:hypothetical protein
MDQPFGPCTFYTLQQQQQRDGGGVFRSLSAKEESRANFCSRKEIIFVQYLALKCFPNAEFICSDLHAGPGQMVLGDYRGDFIDATVLRKPGDLLFLNFHEQGTHYRGHFKEKERQEAGGSSSSSSNHPLVELSLTFACNKPASAFHVYADTLNKDAIKRDYCKSLNAHAARFNYDLKFDYHGVFECELFHSSSSSLDSLMRGEFGKNYIGAFAKEIKYDDMVDKILNTQEVSGFLTLVGGTDGVESGCPNDNAFGFCITKHFVNPQEIGAYSRRQIQKYGYDVDAYCQRSALTVPRLNFPKDSHEVLSIQYFKWLVNVRKLKDFRIHHVAAYTELPNLKGFLNGLLQRRWDLKRSGNGGDLESLTCKLFVNSFYGYSSIFLPKYPKTRMQAETSIMSKGLSKDVLNVTCMGYKRRRSKSSSSSSSSSRRKVIRRNCQPKMNNDEKDYELVFSITEKNLQSKIENVTQVTRDT